MDNLLDLINHKNATYTVYNNSNGFTIHTSLKFKESELYDQKHVLYVSDQTFADVSKSGVIALKRQTISCINLTITTERGDSYPHTTISITSDILRNRK